MTRNLKESLTFWRKERTSIDFHRLEQAKEKIVNDLYGSGHVR
ncbi:hypothetical protein [Paenarthrobacter sp. DKR-5]|nr:hypothetical protein [Paenarthrobacter sp. DKR-5]